MSMNPLFQTSAWRGPPATTRILATLMALAGLLVALTGCAAAAPQALDPSAAAGIKKIVVLRPPQPPEYMVQNLSAVASQFGLIGAAAQAADNADKSHDLTGLLTAQRFDAASLLSTAVAEALKKRGWDATVATAVVPRVAGGEASDDAFYSGLGGDVDAVLIPVMKTVGYVSPPLEEGYLPWIAGEAGLFSARTRSRLYFQVYNYGWQGSKRENVEYLGEKPERSYPSFGAVLASGAAAKGGIEDGVASIAGLIGMQIGLAPRRDGAGTGAGDAHAVARATDTGEASRP